MESPSFIARLLHSVPHVNITLQPVNSTFNPNSDIYIESLGILASIPAALLIISLVGLLLYLLTRCCDRKPRKSKSISCQKFTLFSMTLFCCASIGLGLYGNDDFHNGVLQVLSSGRRVEVLILHFRNNTEWLKQNLKIRTSTALIDLGDLFDRPAHNITAVNILLEHTNAVKNSIGFSISQLETILYLIRPTNQDITLKNVLDEMEFYENVRWPATLGLLTFLLLLCTILMVGVARSSRCALIFFSVFGLLGVTISWLLSGIYLSTSVALGDFCMQPTEYVCNQQKLKDIHQLNCGPHGTSQFILKLNATHLEIDRAKSELTEIGKISRDLYPGVEIGSKINKIQNELEVNKKTLMEISGMLDRRKVQYHYMSATKGLCNGGLFGLSLMMLASLLTAFFLTVLVCVDSHTWIYLTKKQPYIDKSETQPFLTTTTTTSASLSPTAPPISSGTSTINRTLLHHQQNLSNSTVNITAGSGPGVGGVVGWVAGGPGPQPSAGTLPSAGSRTSGGTIGMRGLETLSNGESPPPDYNFVVHGIRPTSGHQTLGRLPSHGVGYLAGPNNGKYATLSKQCKTLESNDCY